jgi:quinol monooxygenase YgiN
MPVSGLVYDHDMLLIVGTFAIPPANLPAARLVMNQMVRSSRAEDGCEALRGRTEQPPLRYSDQASIFAEVITP